MLALTRISRVAVAWLQPRSRVRLSEARGLGTSDAPASSPMAEADAYASIRRGVAPATGRSLADVAAELWGHALPGERAMPGERSARKLLRKPLKGPLYASWYPKRLESYDWNEFKLTEKQIRRQAKLRQLRAAGKGPPKKGSGKRQK
jgi:Mitochondrial ribosomal subunit S27